MSNQYSVEGNWHLDVTPVSQSVIAAFSGRIPLNFSDLMMEAFPGISREDVVKTLGHGGIEGMRNTILNQLDGASDEAIDAMLEEIGGLTSGGENAPVTALLTENMRESLLSRTSRRYEAAPALSQLSAMAIAEAVPLG